MKTSSRVAVSGAAALALGGSFLLGTTVQNPFASSSGSGEDPGRPAAAAKAGTKLAAGDLSLVAAGDCDSLLGWFVDNTRDQVTAWGWGGGVMYGGAVGAMEGDMARDTVSKAIAPNASTAADASVGQGSSATGTNVQEAGVDEPDVVKSHGDLLVRIVGDDLVSYDVSGKEPVRLGRFDLPGRAQSTPEMLLVGDTAVVFEQRFRPDGTVTTVHTVDFSDPKDPDLVDTTSYDAGLLSARQYGETVRLVLGTTLPMLDFVTPQGELTEREALKRNRAVLESSTIEDWLPSVRSGSGDDAQLVDCADMARPEDFTGAGTVSIVGWSADAPEKRSTSGVATSSQLVYSSTDRLYLATTTWGGGCCWAIDTMVDRVMPGPWPGGGDDGTTQLHAFALDGRRASYVGSGEVEGSVRDRWALDAVDGTLRVAVGPSSQTGDWNALVTLKEHDGALEPLGRVDRLGVNEQIMSVRWFDDLAVLVTFRQVDPLYAIDLTDPAHPRKLGALKIPGYSDYLHPIGDHRFLGLGVDADSDGRTRGGQVAVFDLSDPTKPVRQGVQKYSPNIEVRAGQDPRQFTWDGAHRTAYTVIARYGRSGGMTAWVSILTVGEDGSLTRRNVAGTTGYDDVAALRTVPLQDGRVVLVSEDGARFL